MKSPRGGFLRRDSAERCLGLPVRALALCLAAILAGTACDHEPSVPDAPPTVARADEKLPPHDSTMSWEVIKDTTKTTGKVLHIDQTLELYGPVSRANLSGLFTRLYMEQKMLKGKRWTMRLTAYAAPPTAKGDNSVATMVADDKTPPKTEFRDEAIRAANPR